jgi:hypothetical protein
MRASTRAGLDEQRLERALGRARLAEQLLERERALRHVRRVLEQPDVAGGERGRGEAHHLPEREVPRHHGEHHAERVVAHAAHALRVVDPRLGRDEPRACSA